MTGKTAESPFSAEYAGVLDLDELRKLDARHVTLAQAIEQAESAREATLKIKGEMIDELERFRAAMRQELKGSRIKPDVLRDVLAVLGLSGLAGGVSVAFHWSYALIVVGGVVFSLSVVPLLRRAETKS